MLPALLAHFLLRPELTDRWIYLSTNFYVEENVVKNLELVKRAKSAGYNGFVVADSKFMRWDSLEPRYAKNASRFRKAVKDAGMEFIACVAPVGYSNDLLSRDPNLAEGLPVVDQKFVVTEDRKIVPVDEGGELQNGSFESFTGDSPNGWAWVDAPGKVCFIDTSEHTDGKASLRMTDIGQNGNGRAQQKILVKPFHNYVVSFDVKTKDFDTPGNTNITILSPNGQSMQQTALPITRDSDWKTVNVTFNSLDNKEVLFYAGVWGGKKGTIWWDNFRINSAGLVNLVRRPGAPFKVTDGSAKTIFTEGTDFEKAVDPKLGNEQWSGDFSAWHKQPEWSLTKESKLKPGDSTLVSYFHTPLIYDGQVTCCPHEPKTYEIIKWQLEQMKSNLQPDGYLLSHDEIRVGGWDDSCKNAAKTPGQGLALHVKKCIELTKSIDPGKEILVWSDMFDPFHNAQPNGWYYLLNGQGPWSKSWEGLSKDVVVINWNSGDENRKKSFDFFQQRGHRQILAGYYDGGGIGIDKWIQESVSPLGVMYTTWQGDYSALETFAKKCR